MELCAADFFIVTVPTPIDDARRPDVTALLEASKTVGGVLKKDDIVVFESTVYPGTTEEDLRAGSGAGFGSHVRELQSFGVTVQVHDPVADPAAVLQEYGLVLQNDRCTDCARVLAPSLASRRPGGASDALGADFAHLEVLVGSCWVSQTPRPLRP
jgi:hypothetical protein